VVGEEGNNQILLNLSVNNVARCIGSNAKTLGLRDMQFPNMGASSGPPDGARVVHHETDELLVQQITIPVGNTNCIFGRFLTLPVSLLLSFITD
jgi:hypothetical protein